MKIRPITKLMATERAKALMILSEPGWSRSSKAQMKEVAMQAPTSSTRTPSFLKI